MSSKHIPKLHQVLLRVRPMQLQFALLRLIAPREGRNIELDPSGIKVYVDPFTNLGLQIRAAGGFEPETMEMLRGLLHVGDTFLDVGANEGIVSAFAGTLVGMQGRVIAVEPQPALEKFIRINAALNDVRNLTITCYALGGSDGEERRLYLYPELNTGATSFVRRHPLSFLPSRRIKARFASLDTVLALAGVTHIDVAKVDVEGFEPEVVETILPNIVRGQIRLLLVDYHKEILASRNLSATPTDSSLLDAGMRVAAGDHLTGGYVLYEFNTEAAQTDGSQRDLREGVPVQPDWVQSTTERCLRFTGSKKPAS